MPKQFELNFTSETPEEESQRLRAKYKEIVGVVPHVMLEKDAIMNAITDPEAEKTRLREIAKNEDEEETERTYRR
ncbi:MAG: hypothetical protein PHH40_00275 [Candidatus Moranbacteria bacterium]|nr:hypothetical protein [Candidatus Moranbacteria bacterium]MDD3965302.1 hypothetical protein [Candidatus Moranbacteria bacterium]